MISDLLLLLAVDFAAELQEFPLTPFAVQIKEWTEETDLGAFRSLHEGKTRNIMIRVRVCIS